VNHAPPADAPNVDSEVYRKAAADEAVRELRHQLARFTSQTFAAAGKLLHVGGHIIGFDRVTGRSPFGHGSDETVAVSLLLRISADLISAASDLFFDGHHYAAAALLRQIVEIEYLAWTFETKDQEGERWLRSTRVERQTFFTPAKLRSAAGNRFRGVDYGYHCELGGHPVPGAQLLLNENIVVAQLLLSDLLGHSGPARRRVRISSIHDMDGSMASRVFLPHVTADRMREIMFSATRARELRHAQSVYLAATTDWTYEQIGQLGLAWELEQDYNYQHQDL
jgi:hypothetical protein